MSANNELPAAEGMPSDGPAPGELDAPAAQPQSNGTATNNEAFIAKLKQNLEQTRLPPEERDRILADMPPAEEQERLYREMVETVAYRPRSSSLPWASTSSQSREPTKPRRAAVPRRLIRPLP